MKQALQEKTIIATRDFTRGFARIAKRPLSRHYVVINHGKVIGTFTPQPPDQRGNDNWWAGYEGQEPFAEPKKSLTLNELREKYGFHSGEKHLSQRIDEIVYGIKR